MASTAWLYATTASGGSSNPARATGAPDGLSAVLDEGSGTTLTLSGFGAQAAIGSPPVSIDAVRVRVRMRGSSGGFASAGEFKANDLNINPLTSVGSTLSNYTWTAPAGLNAWAALGTLTVTSTYSRYGSNREIDSVGIQVDYTTSVDHPLAGGVPVASSILGSLSALRALAGVIPVLSSASGVAEVLPGGLSGIIPATSTITGGMGLLAGLTGTIPATSGVNGSVTARRGFAGTIPITSTVQGAVARVDTQIVREPVRTLDQLLTGSHQREDHVVILTGDHAGERLPLLGGELTLDEASDVHATGTLTLPPEPRLAGLLDPLTARTELAIILAVRGDDDHLHTWQRAVVHATEQPRGVAADGGLALSVRVADRSDWVRKTGMREPYAGSGSVSIMTHALRLVAQRAPWLPIGEVRDPGYRSGTDLHVGGLGDDPWTHAVQLAWSVGERLYVDAQGRLASRSVLAADIAQARWVAGEDDCLVDSMSTSRSDADVCNVLGVPWEEARPEDAAEDWVPRSGVSWWEDTSSPLGTQGPLGERVRAYSGDASVIHTAAHALDVAVSHGVTQQGVLVPLDFAVRCDPRLDVGSTVHVSRPELDVDELCRISVLRLGLGEPLMAGSMDTRRLLT